MSQKSLQIEQVEIFILNQPTRGYFKFLLKDEQAHLVRPSIIVKVTTEDGFVG